MAAIALTKNYILKKPKITQMRTKVSKKSGQFNIPVRPEERSQQGLLY